ncbi:MAG: hypothetical protein AAF267_01345 [Deinococcota bacterium]
MSKATVDNRPPNSFDREYSSYITEAIEVFCRGTYCKTPNEVVGLGLKNKTMSDWTQLLDRYKGNANGSYKTP